MSTCISYINAFENGKYCQKWKRDSELGTSETSQDCDYCSNSKICPKPIDENPSPVYCYNKNGDNEMSYVCAIKGKEGIVIASDSRNTVEGKIYIDNQKKIISISDGKFILSQTGKNHFNGTSFEEMCHLFEGRVTNTTSIEDFIQILIEYVSKDMNSSLDNSCYLIISNNDSYIIELRFLEEPKIKKWTSAFFDMGVYTNLFTTMPSITDEFPLAQIARQAEALVNKAIIKNHISDEARHSVGGDIQLCIINKDKKPEFFSGRNILERGTIF